MRRRSRALAIVLIIVGGLTPAGHATAASGAESAPAAKTVNVFAAASLTPAFQAIAAAFEQEHGGVEIQLNFAGSPTLVQQIREGAPADVFASADEATMQKLAESGHVTGVPAIFARNALQIAVATGNPKHLTGLADLVQPGLTIALCGPTVPCGRYAADAFAKAQLIPPTASQEIDVKAVVSKVAIGEADAGVVYVTDVRAAGGKVEGIDIPEASNVVARYPIAALKRASDAAMAAAFVDFVLSADGQKMLAASGFLAR